MTANRRAVAALVGGAALLVGGGAAFAENGGAAREDRCQERLARIAERRGVSPDELQVRAHARLTARVDRALAAGRISAARAAQLKQRIAEGQVCRRPGVALRIRRLALLRFAARYLELTPAELRTQLAGTSLATLAERSGKSAQGLKTALLGPATARIERAVRAGRLDGARAEAVLARLDRLVDRLVARTFPAR